MTKHQLLNLILSDRNRIAAVIATGAAWEIWMQVELMFLLTNAGLQVARELPYPGDYGALRLDLLAHDPDNTYAIELKVESANNSGRALLVNAKQDIVKISDYTPNPGVRVVVAISYSGEARDACQRFANNHVNDAIYEERDFVGVLVVNVR